MKSTDDRLPSYTGSSKYVPYIWDRPKPGAHSFCNLPRLCIAVLVDGGFYLKQRRCPIDSSSPAEEANLLFHYSLLHVPPDCRLYRIFYYDCPPSSKRVFHLLLDRTVDLTRTPSYSWNSEFQNILRTKDHFAVRMGELLDSQSEYVLKKKSVRDLFKGRKKLNELTPDDFTLDITQKGVDMRIGLDIATLAHKKLVDRIVLIGGDSDIVPTAKHARREGLEFVLDPMGHPITSSLREHIDVLEDLSGELKPDLAS